MSRFGLASGLAFTILLASAVSSVACKRSGGDSMPSSLNCFTKLQPGPIEGNKLRHVALLNGQCRGEYHALNSFTIKETVWAFIEGGDASSLTESPIEIQGEAALLNAGGSKKSFGRYKRNGAEAQLDLHPGTQIQLQRRAKDGPWQIVEPGTPAKGLEERIVIIIAQESRG
jgi:hypothetical protein